MYSGLDLKQQKLVKIKGDFKMKTSFIILITYYFIVTFYYAIASLSCWINCLDDLADELETKSVIEKIFHNQIAVYNIYKDEYNIFGIIYLEFIVTFSFWHLSVLTAVSIFIRFIFTIGLKIMQSFLSLFKKS